MHRRHYHIDSYGNRGGFLAHEGRRERDLSLIGYAQPTNNVYSDTNDLDGCCVSRAHRILQAVFGR